MNATKQIICHEAATQSNESNLIAWLPLAVMTPAILILWHGLAPWILMWLLAFALFLGCKWLTWWQNKNIPANPARHLAYLIAWPGMDAKAFLNAERTVPKPHAGEWGMTILKIVLGAALLWVVARHLPSAPLLQGWVGLIGLILMLHFGTFHLIALAWQFLGVDARPLMRAPIRSTSLAEFWGIRWNSAFNRLVHDWTFRPLYRRLGTAGATMIVFLISGLAHELVISVPARGGYGLPTIYFLIQGAGLLLERTTLARRLGLGFGLTGWVFTVAVTVGPVACLLHPPFITRVILPFLHALNAI